MKCAASIIMALIGSIGFLTSPAVAGNKIDGRLRSVLESIGPNDEVVAWVFFTDKGTHEFMKSSVPHSVVSEKSIRRRMKVRPLSEVVDYTDLPVEKGYVEQISSRVLRVRQQSKWFNGVSVHATKSQILDLESLAFVKAVELVARFKKDNSEDEVPAAPPPNAPSKPEGGSGVNLDYGPSFGQVNQINVPAVHNTGNYAQGVIVGVFDNGFRLLTHEAFDSMSIIATYDFVDHDVNPAPPPWDPASYGAHGVNTLSTIGGYKPGQLIGPAFGASYILARTENDSSETPIEEDYWVAAIEWADSIGVEVTSTSLGYLTYDPPYTSWTWQDMDGNTTVITRAGDMAAGRGIIVVNSAGNNGYNSSHNTLNAPADGDSVLAAGAVTSSGTISGFSSCGPTTSVPPRIKPDILAQGSSVRVASSSNPTGYGYASGTSFSCPLSAGVAALIVNARPNATPVEIANAMRLTGSRAGNPDNQYGWGILDAAAAINYLNPNGTGGHDTKPTAYALEQNYPNPFNPATTIRYGVPEPAWVTIRIYDVLGHEVRVLVDAQQSATTHTTNWDGTDNHGNPVASGVYIYRLSAAGTLGYYNLSKKLVVLR